MNQQIKTGAGIIIVVAIVSAIGFFAWKIIGIKENKDRANPAGGHSQNSQVCTQDAKLCPDGSYVSRTGPNCEFTECSDSGDSEIIGGDRDEHGCLGPAGYQWCEEKQKCLRIWETPCNDESNVHISFSPNQFNDCEKNSAVTYKVLGNEKEIGTVETKKCSSEIKFIGKNGQFAYFEIRSVGIGGYIVVDTGYFDVYQINLSDNSIKKLGESITFNEDFSKFVLDDIENGKVILKNTGSEIEKYIKLPDKYNPGENQLGDFAFSPNSNKIAIKFVYGDPGQETCEIYVYDINADTLTLYKRINYLIEIDGWKNNDEVNWKKM